jgi:predicted negative regulator of RcsB-dependent stress response
MTVKNDQTLWQSYGKHFIVLLVIALTFYGGWEYYKNRQQQKLEAASIQYDKMLNDLRAKEYAKAEESYQIIQNQYRKTPYATLASLLQARVDLEQNATDKAISHLQEAMETAKNQKGPMEHVARVRLARLLSDQKKYKEALALLTSSTTTEGYLPLYEETKGDIYVLQNDLDKARESYALALKAVPQGVTANALQIKLTDLKNREE